MHILLLLAALNWNADLAHLATELPKMHPNAFHNVTREAFHADIERLRTRAPQLQPHEVVVEMAGIVASIGDGHTRLTFPLDPAHGFFQGHSKTDPPNDPSLVFSAIPLRFVILSHGLYTSDGRKIERIGPTTVAEAMEAVRPVAHRDNESQLREILASYLSIPEVLHARGVIDDRSRVPVTFADGQTVVYEPGPPPPQEKPEGPWSFTHLADKRTVYFRYDEVANTKEETLAQFARRMFAFIEDNPVDRLIIDMRNNWGGNGSLNNAVLHGIIRSAKLQRPGSLFVLTGRRTFSASIFLLLDLEEQTSAIFIGEPTGGKPTSYGDSRKMKLPSSGLTVRVSTLYWQADPRDKRQSIAPHVFVESAIGSDPELAEALDFFGAGEPRQSWSGVVSVDHHRFPFTLTDGKLTVKDFDLVDVPLEKSPYPVTIVRAGSKRMVATMSAEGREFLLVGE